MIWKELLILKKNNIHFVQGIYAGIKGPSLETSAERRFLNIAGADAVGMSTVLENISAIHCGFKVLIFINLLRYLE